MQIKITRVYLSGGARIRELFEENARKDDKIRELDKALHFKQLQHRGYAKELEKQLREIEELKTKIQTAQEDRDEWIRKYKISEDARKSLGEKLEKAMGAIELIRGSTPSAGSGDSSTERGALKGGAEA